MKYLPITVIVVLLASLLVALVFNPVLCARFMRVPARAGEQKRIGDRWIAFGLRTYEPVIRWALRHKALTLGGMTVLLILIVMLFARFNAGVELFPDTDPTFAYVNLDAPSGTRVELSDAYSQQIEAEVMAVPELKAVVTEVGSGGSNGLVSSGSGSNMALVSLEFIKMEERSVSSRESLADLRSRLAAFTGAKLRIEKMDEGPPTGAPVSIEISGDDFERLGGLAERVQDEIRDIPGLVNLSDNYDQGRPEIKIRPSLEKAARLGLRTIDVASTIRTAIHGEDVSKYREGEDEYDIVVRLAEPTRRNVEDLEELTVFYEGEHIPLGAFADVRYETGLGAINRIDSKRVVTVSADAGAGFNSNALLAEVQERLSGFTLPKGYHIEFAGENEEQEKASAFLGDAFRIALMLILLVLITQFTSLSVPVVIMSSVILSLIGVFFGLMITRTPFGIIMTGVGVISLAGVVVNNAIVLLDYVIRLRKRGLDKIEAIVQGGKTRFRPVILTAVTTILGLIPLTTGFSLDFGRLFAGEFDRIFIIGGESSQWWGPMGTAVIWGLAVATFLTLVVVPVMYASVEPVLSFLRLLLVDLPTRPFRRERRAA